MKKYIRCMGVLENGHDHTNYNPTISPKYFLNILQFASQTGDRGLANGALRCAIADADHDIHDPNLPHTNNSKAYYRTEFYDVAVKFSSVLNARLLNQLDRLTI